MQPTRRTMLKGLGAIGCSLAAHPLTTTMTFAAAPGENRLVVLILRGAMDGIGTLQPVADPAYARLRPELSRASPGADLTQGFALHPRLDPLRPLWAAGELAFVPAVSTPYRDQRSHFDGQDMLEAGTGRDVPVGAVRGGWLNRMLGVVPGVTAETAFAIGRDTPLILTGDQPISSWSPATRLDLSPQARLLLERLYEADPLFHAAAFEALELAESLGRSEEVDSFGEMMRMTRDAQAEERAAEGARALASFAAARLREETRIASFSLTGWDTHRGQRSALDQALRRLSDSILTLRDELGPLWGKTAVLAVTEFGRTAAENGTGGTDHGTGGLMLLVGGAVRGGRLFGGWPGLDESALYDRRDLMPLDDVRRYAAWVLRGLYGIEAGTLGSVVFPGLDLGDDPGVLV